MENPLPVADTHLVNEITIDGLRWLVSQLAWERTLADLRGRHAGTDTERTETSLPRAA